VRSPRPRVGVALLLLGALIAAACGSSEGDERDGAAGVVNVFAAASLTEVFTELGEAFEADHPGVEITFNFAGSSALAEQVNQGAPADVLVTADESTMKKVVDAGNAAGPATLARNRLAILVEKGNPTGITRLADLARPGVTFVLCVPEVPCGKFGAAALERARVTTEPASLEENVKAVVARVTLGEADAGIVYVTDVKAAGDRATGIDIDIDLAADPSLEAVYQAAITAQVGNERLAEAWIEFVLSDEGQSALSSYGFLAP
jgi:molybdate transport system substrate-binding protein